LQGEGNAIDGAQGRGMTEQPAAATDLVVADKAVGLEERLAQAVPLLA
jgi:hypothetical protein